MNANTPTQLTLQLLGGFHVAVDGSPVPPSAWGLRTAGLLVKALALAPHYRLHREQLMDLLWPDADPDTARSNLRYTLHFARRSLESSGADAAGLLVREGDLLALGDSERIQSDVAVFEDAVANAWRTRDMQRFREAADRCTGDLLPDDHDDWINERREMLRTSHLAILQRLAELDESASPVRPGPDIPNNLPAPLTHLIGREGELGEVRRLLATHQLVTLTGPGGVGKTRLAEEVGLSSLADFPDGVWFVSLAAIRDSELVLPTVARSLRLQPMGEADPLDALVAHCSDRHSLLILDNFEYLLGAGPLVAKLLSRCPALTVLTTSRVRLRLPGEQVYPIPSLDLPQQSEEDHARLSTYPTIRLFAERAVEVDPSFRLTATTAPLVAEICRRLDGLPLAIELAAARIDAFPLPSLVDQIDRRLSVLADGPRDLPERQQTLWNTIAWSYDLLTEDEQTLYRWLSVFAGGWTVEAATAVAGERVCGDVGLDIAARLERLTDHHLIFREATDHEPRLTMLETIREYGLEQLIAHEEADEAHACHAQHVLAMGEQMDQDLRWGRSETHWLRWLTIEEDNLRHAIDWSRSHDVQVAARLVCGLASAVQLRGVLFEYGRWYDQVIQNAAELPEELRSRLTLAGGMIAGTLGDLDAAEQRLRACLPQFQTEGEDEFEATALNAIGTSLVWNSGGDVDEAVESLERALSIWKRLGNTFQQAIVLSNLGAAAIFSGEHELARLHYLEALRLSRLSGSLLALGMTLNNLGDLEYRSGNVSAAYALFSECLEISSVDDFRGMMLVVSNLGLCAVAMNEMYRGVVLLIAAQEASAITGELVHEQDLALMVDALESARAALGNDAYERACREGRSTSIAEAAAIALELSETGSLARS